MGVELAAQSHSWWPADFLLEEASTHRSQVAKMRMQKPRPGDFSIILSATLLLLTGCGDSSNGIGPENQLEVTNAVDQFQFQLTALEKVTDRRRYDWENTGPRATIDISQAITGGSATLTIRDGEGTVLYNAEISQENETTTPAGVSGTWEIEVVLTKCTGTFNFRVQKAT